MLKALLRGKSRLSRDPDEPWTAVDEYRDREDPLTSFVFGTLLYLPADCLWRILRAAAATPHASVLPNAAGELAPPEFWPSWWLKTSGPRQRVEPDVFLSFEACNVIIEAKRHDGHQMQYAAQLARELGAYFQARGTGKPMYLLAVGGLLSTDPQPTQLLRQEVADELKALIGTSAIPLAARIEVVPWGRILRAVREMLETDGLSREYKAILDDVEAVFDVHHIVDWQPTWLSELATLFAEYRLAPADWTGLAWRATTSSHCAHEENSVNWWREAAAYRPGDDRAQSVFERLVGA